MKKRSALLALALLLPVLVSCKPADLVNIPDGTATHSSVELRPAETITLNRAWQGEFHPFPGIFFPFGRPGYFVDGNFLEMGRLYDLKKTDLKTDFAYAVISPEGEITGYRGRPYCLRAENDNEQYIRRGEAVYEGGIAVWDEIYRLDPSTNQRESTKSRTLAAYNAENNLLYTMDPEPLIENRTNPLTGSDADFTLNPASMLYGANGTLYLIMEYSVVAIGPDGEKLYETGPEYYINEAVQHPDGRILVHYTKLPEVTHHWAYMDDDHKGFSDPIAVPDPGLEEYTLVWGGGHDFYFNARDGLYCMDEGDDAPILLCSWEESGVKYDIIRFLMIPDAETVLVFTSTTVGMSSIREYAVLKRPPADESSTRQVITLGENNSHIDFTGYAAAFNRTSDRYYIVVRDYAKYTKDTGIDMQEDILGNNAPDIVFASGRQMDNLSGKGAFVDLNPYLSKDKEFREDLIPGILTPREIDGKLYQLASGVKITGLSGKAKNLPTVEEWTPEVFFTLLDSAEKSGIAAIADTYRAQMKGFLIGKNLSSFVDFENAVCTFDSEQFITTLRYLKDLPENRTVGGEVQDLRKGYREDTVLLDPNSSIGSFMNLMNLRVQFNEEEIAYLGIPTPDGGIPVLSLGDSFAITADSPVKEGAWEFIRYILEEERMHYGSSLAFLPVTKTNIRLQAEAEGESYYMYSLDRAAPNIVRWNGVDVPEYDSTRIIAATVTEADAEFVLDLLQNRTFYISTSAHERINELIDEELAVFFAGSITAEEAARRIQSRVSIYLAEQS